MVFINRRMRIRWARDSKTKIAWSFFIFVCLVVFIDSFGFVTVYFEKDFETEFSYPLHVYDFPSLVHRFRNGEKVEYEPTNTNYSGIKFQETANHDCRSERPLGLLILVKSAPGYFDKRAAIRSTWGNAQYLLNISNSISSSSSLLSCFNNQFEKSPNLSHNQHKPSTMSVPSDSQPSIFPIKLVFLLGTEGGSSRTDSLISTEMATALEDPLDNENININHVPNNNEKDKNSQNQRSNSNLRSRRLRDNFKNDKQRSGDGVEASLREEILKYNDIVRSDFIDSYENNTYKTMAGLRWAVEICPDFQYAFLVDDDMFISVKNLIKFMEAPRNYPRGGSGSSSAKCSKDNNKVGGNGAVEKIYAGKVLVTRPIRYKLVSKWYLSLDEYPFNYFPPYMPAAAILMSKPVVEDFYYASLFTQHFRFDDIFLAILAYKMKIAPLSSNYFHVCHTADGKCSEKGMEHDSSGSSNSNNNNDPMAFVIARHGLSGPKELIELWNEQKSSGKLYL